MSLKNEKIDPRDVKSKSEKIILDFGGVVLDWLPTIDLKKPRELKEIINRALVLNALFQLHLNAPKYAIAAWIEQNSLRTNLTPNELTILYSQNELTLDEHYELYWSLESLWALAWVTKLIPDLPFNQQVGKELASLSPNLQINEDGYKYLSTMQLRPLNSIFMMLDLYYRVHWWLNDAKINNKPTTPIEINMIIARRKALEWVLDATMEWDTVDLSI